MRRIFLFLAILLVFISCQPGPKEIGGVNLSGRVEYRRSDATENQFICNHASLASLKAKEWAKNGSKEALRISVIEPRIWLRFALENENEIPWKGSILLQWIHIPDLELCSESTDGQILDQYAGYHWESWLGVLSPFPHFQISLSPKERKVFYLRVRTTDDLNYPIRLLSEDQYRGILMVRFLAFVSLSFMGLIFLAWGLQMFFKNRNPVFLALVFFYASFYLLVYCMHGKVPASIFGESNLLVTHSFYIWFALLQFAFFLYLASFDFSNQKRLYKKGIFWLFAISGLLYLIIPYSDLFREYRIFVALINFILAFYWLYVTHVGQTQNTRPRLYLITWMVFLLLIFFRVLYHLDFYPYQVYVIYSSVVWLPFQIAYSLLLAHKGGKEKGLQALKNRNLFQNVDLVQITSRLNELLEKERVYLDPNFSEEKAAQLLGITYHQMSDLVNTHYKSNFPSLLNKYRISHAKSLLISEPDMNVTEVGKNSGFGSRSAFYSEFKKQTGSHPNAFKKMNVNSKSKDIS
ncbi:helix-turn-helix domain-containing protein [Leptospira ryugenii]|uniref:helix-turn-helix domain-containing protein n=1 Tax=Leptospira ryugenii TaxID=1917863 RepID=UPI000D59C964|nr:helix-turn-helix domain-containing protein [Leptospira ryugenii]